METKWRVLLRSHQIPIIMGIDYCIGRCNQKSNKKSRLRCIYDCLDLAKYLVRLATGKNL